MISKLNMKYQGLELYKIYTNHDPGMTLTYFVARSTYASHAFEWGKLLQCHLTGKIFNGQMDRRFKILKKFGTQGLVCLHPRAIYMYRNIIFKDHFLQNPWPIKVKFYRKHLYGGGTNVFINNSGHITKMSAMPIYGKNPAKIFSETDE